MEFILGPTHEAYCHSICRFDKLTALRLSKGRLSTGGTA